MGYCRFILMSKVRLKNSCHILLMLHLSFVSFVNWMVKWYQPICTMICKQRLRTLFIVQPSIKNIILICHFFFFCELMSWREFLAIRSKRASAGLMLFRWQKCLKYLTSIRIGSLLMTKWCLVFVLITAICPIGIPRNLHLKMLIFQFYGGKVARRQKWNS